MLWEKEVGEILNEQFGNRDEENSISLDTLNNTINDFIKIFYAIEPFVKAAAAAYFSTKRDDFINFDYKKNSYGVTYLPSLNGEQRLIVVINNNEGFSIDTFSRDGNVNFKPRYHKRTDVKNNPIMKFGVEALEEIERIKNSFTASDSKK